jgi:hypothetical protein
MDTFFPLIIIFLLVALYLINPTILSEGFSGYTLEDAMGQYPGSLTDVLVQDSFPRLPTNGISDKTANDMWWRYPIFEVGSYAQITNNIRFPDNPDVGTCTPASICFSLYKNRQNKESNYVKPLPPVNPSCQGTRVGYFNTPINLLPFRTDMPNILY